MRLRDLKPPLSSLSREDLLRLVLTIRASRQIFKTSYRKPKSKPSASSKGSVIFAPTKMSPAEAEALLTLLKSKMKERIK
jgi:hypothetical protein